MGSKFLRLVLAVIRSAIPRAFSTTSCRSASPLAGVEGCNALDKVPRAINWLVDAGDGEKELGALAYRSSLSTGLKVSVNWKVRQCDSAIKFRCILETFK